MKKPFSVGLIWVANFRLNSRELKHKKASFVGEKQKALVRLWTFKLKMNTTALIIHKFLNKKLLMNDTSTNDNRSPHISQFLHLINF